MSQSEPIPKEEPAPLEADELVWLLARALQEWDSGDRRIVSISCDGDHKSTELMVNCTDGRSFIIRSGDIKEEASS
jgi:hypothetical protein